MWQLQRVFSAGTTMFLVQTHQVGMATCFLILTASSAKAASSFMKLVAETQVRPDTGFLLLRNHCPPFNIDLFRYNYYTSIYRLYLLHTAHFSSYGNHKCWVQSLCLYVLYCSCVFPKWITLFHQGLELFACPLYSWQWVGCFTVIFLLFFLLLLHQFAYRSIVNKAVSSLDHKKSTRLKAKNLSRRLDRLRSTIRKTDHKPHSASSETAGAGTQSSSEVVSDRESREDPASVAVTPEPHTPELVRKAESDHSLYTSDCDSAHQRNRSNSTNSSNYVLSNQPTPTTDDTFFPTIAAAAAVKEPLTDTEKEPVSESDQTNEVQCQLTVTHVDADHPDLSETAGVTLISQD